MDLGGVAGMANSDVALSGLTCRHETERDVIDGITIIRPFCLATRPKTSVPGCRSKRAPALAREGWIGRRYRGHAARNPRTLSAGDGLECHQSIGRSGSSILSRFDITLRVRACIRVMQ